MEISDLILYRDRQCIVLNKPPGLPVQEDVTGDISLLRMAQAYCKHDLYLWNRIDRPVSGLVVFAKTQATIRSLSLQQQRGEVKKRYLAVVQKPVAQREATLTHYIRKLKSRNKSIVSDHRVAGDKQCVLHYTVAGEIDRYVLLEVNPETGRHHQIRAQLGFAGMPVKGDVKYGYRRSGKDRSIHLHAWQVTFRHPTKNLPVTVVAPPPDDPVWNAFTFNYSNPDHGKGES